MRSFIPVDEIASKDIFHDWSDWDPYAVIGDPTSERIEQLGMLSDRALVAYATACAEWVVARFSAISDDPVPGCFLEAAWLCQVDSSRRPPPESEESDWKGATRGAIDLALMTVLNAIGSTDGGKPEVDAALAERIALHVLPDAAPFVVWRDCCLPVLQVHFLRGSDAGRTLGLPPRVFEQGFLYEHLDRYCGEFMSSVDLAANPFLRP